jgi:flagellar protein FliJ
MHTPDTQTLGTVLEHAQGARDAAALALQRAEQQLGAAQAQAAQLVQYRAEYITRWSAHFSQPAAMELVHCYRSFMQRLDQALAQQQGMVERQAHAAQHCRSRLQDAETRVAAVQKLIDRRVQEHQRGNARREQKQSDESARQSPWGAGGDFAAPL